MAALYRAQPTINYIMQETIRRLLTTQRRRTVCTAAAGMLMPRRLYDVASICRDGQRGRSAPPFLARLLTGSGKPAVTFIKVVSGDTEADRSS